MFIQHDVTGAQVPLRHGLKSTAGRVSRQATRNTTENFLPKRSDCRLLPRIDPARNVTSRDSKLFTIERRFARRADL
jgi:hypothetical protein